MRRNDPRIRQTLNQISQNLESANLSTQASLFSFSQNYVSPCFSSVQTCLEASCQPCFAARDERRRPHRSNTARQRRRGSLSFDFYDDWEQDEAEWGNDELDRLLSGNNGQPTKQGGMSYGSRGGGKRKPVGLPKDREVEDPNVVPRSSMFGFLERLPWRIGGRGVRYRPSVADLQENVGRRGAEVQPLIDEGEDGGRGRHGRSRSGTVGSRDTANSLSSRGDLFPSEDEDDAVPLDDEFAMALERRTTGATSDEHSSGKKGGTRASNSRTSIRTASSKERKSNRERRATSPSGGKAFGLKETAEEYISSVSDLKQEEERLRRDEEAQIEERRQAAQKLALERGLSKSEAGTDTLESDQDFKGTAIIQGREVLPSEEEGIIQTVAPTYPT